MTCPKCQSANTRTIRELFDPSRTARYCDDCQHLWWPPTPVYVTKAEKAND